MNLELLVRIGDISEIDNKINSLSVVEHAKALDLIVGYAARYTKLEILNNYFHQSSMNFQKLANIAAANGSIDVIRFLDELTSDSTYLILDFTEIAEYATKYGHYDLIEILYTDYYIDTYRIGLVAALYGRFNVLHYIHDLIDNKDSLHLLLYYRGYHESTKTTSNIQQAINEIISIVDDNQQLDYNKNQLQFNQEEIEEMIKIRDGLIDFSRNVSQQICADLQAANGRHIVFDSTVDSLEVLKYLIKYKRTNQAIKIIYSILPHDELFMACVYCVIYEEYDLFNFLMEMFVVNKKQLLPYAVYMHNIYFINELSSDDMEYIDIEQATDKVKDILSEIDYNECLNYHLLTM